jgi:hypothetical protein
MNFDRLGSRAYIVDMIGIGKKVDGTLTVKKEIVGINGSLPSLLCKDDNAEGVTCNRCIINVCTDRVDLLRGLGVRANRRDIPEFVAFAAAHIRRFLLV